VLQAGLRQPRLDAVLHVGGQVVVGHGGRVLGEQRVGLEREVIAAQSGAADIGQRLSRSRSSAAIDCPGSAYIRSMLKVAK
jgi:hypothetical protein